MQELFRFQENQLIVAGFGIFFHIINHTGQFTNHQFAGGIDDTADTEVTTDGTQILFGKRDMDVTTDGAGRAVETDDLTMLGDIPNIDTTGIPDSAGRNTANTA